MFCQKLYNISVFDNRRFERAACKLFASFMLLHQYDCSWCKTGKLHTYDTYVM